MSLFFSFNAAKLLLFRELCKLFVNKLHILFANALPKDSARVKTSSEKGVTLHVIVPCESHTDNIHHGVNKVVG